MIQPRFLPIARLFLLALFCTAIVACTSNEPFKQTGEYLDDSVITTRVKASLAKSKETSALNINVVTEQGVVQLSGFIKSEEERRAAISITRQIPGVKAIQDKMSIKPPAEE